MKCASSIGNSNLGFFEMVVKSVFWRFVGTGKLGNDFQEFGQDFTDETGPA